METAWANEASSFSPSSSIAPQFNYEVFLSFSGVDTCNNFTSHLLAALEQQEFHTFRDDTELNRGEYIGNELLKAIEKSRISLVVLSKNYTESRWCLDELVKIMECRKTLQQIVLPIFYNVEPSDERAQKGSLAEAFAKHAEHFNEGPSSMVEKWKEALTQVASLSGWDLPKVENGNEAKSIQKIVEEVGNRLDIAHLNVADHQVGLESRLQNLKDLLSMESSNVFIVGICGIGGIGKTTIAMKLYNVIQHMFDGSSFIANVRETSKQSGLVALQEQLLSDICTNGTHHVRNYYQGIEVIKRRAFCRKVLLVLDDVDNVQQLKALAIDRNYFASGSRIIASGSRIIITTRDVSLLNLLKVDEIYAPEELNRSESLELLSWHALKEDHPKDNYLDLSIQVLAYAGGLPLALEVLGSFLYDKSTPEWKSAISKLKKIPHVDIQAKLKISFDSLCHEVKELFLDMACFFAGTGRNFVVKILESCNSFAEIGVRVLADRCLVKDDGNQIVMHDMLRDMGREIIRQESVKEPGRRSRLWYHEDALEVLVDGTGTEAIEGLFLNFHEPNQVQVNSKAFEKMNRLWLLHLNYVHLREGCEHISRRLLWLGWKGFPFKFLPSSLHMENLVALDLRYSSLKKAWKGTKILVKLKFLYLSHCYHLIKTPDFSGLTNLEELFLNDCVRLVEVGESIRFLNKLLVLDMKNCKKLQKLPSSILMLETLESLDLSGCSMLGNFSGFKGSPSKSQSSFLSSWIFRTKRVDSIGLSLSSVQDLSCLKELRMENCNLSCLPNEVGKMKSLETLDLGGNNFRNLPDSIYNLTRLKKLNLSGCDLSHVPSEIGRLVTVETSILQGSSSLSLPGIICNLTRLEQLSLKDCNVSHLPSEVGQLISLETLDLGGNNLRSLPDYICDLTCLKDLNLKDCNVTHLPREIGQLISLQTLDLAGNNLLTLPDSFCDLACLKKLYLRHYNVSHLPGGIGMLSSLQHLDLESNNVCSLPNSFSDLASLEVLNLSNCGRLQSLPELPVTLRDMDASYCTLLESIPAEFNWQAGIRLTLPGCNMLAKNNLANNAVEGFGQQKEWSVHETGINLSGDEVPNWIQYQSTGSKLTLVVPPRRILGWILCIVFRTHEKPGERGIKIVCNKTDVGIYTKELKYHDQDQMLIHFLPTVPFMGRYFYGEGELEIEISPYDEKKTVGWLTVKKWGISLVCEDDGDNTETNDL